MEDYEYLVFGLGLTAVSTYAAWLANSFSRVLAALVFARIAAVSAIVTVCGLMGG